MVRLVCSIAVIQRQSVQIIQGGAEKGNPNVNSCFMNIQTIIDQLIINGCLQYHCHASQQLLFIFRHLWFRLNTFPATRRELPSYCPILDIGPDIRYFNRRNRLGVRIGGQFAVPSLRTKVWLLQ